MLSLKNYNDKNRKNNLIIEKCYILMIYNYVKKYRISKTLIVFEIISNTVNGSHYITVAANINIFESHTDKYK